MHHYGRRALEMMGTYRVSVEPENKYDPFAVAVYDGPRKVANLKRHDARVVHDVLSSPYPKSAALLRPTDMAETKTQKIGPQQACAIVFKCEAHEVDLVKTVVSRQSNHLTGIYVKAMDLPKK